MFGQFQNDLNSINGGRVGYPGYNNNIINTGNNSNNNNISRIAMMQGNSEDVLSEFIPYRGGSDVVGIMSAANNSGLATQVLQTRNSTA